MKTRNRNLIAAGVGLAMLAVVGVALSAPSATDGSSPVTRSSPVPSTSSTAATPAPVTSESASQDPPQATIDPYYGDVVVLTASSEPASFASGLTVELISVSETTASASGVGATGGAAVEVTLLVTNTSGATVSLSPVVNAFAGDERTPLTPDHATALSESLASAAQSTGSYTFAVDDDSSTIWVTVSTSPESGLVVFEHRR